jgi:hypothetical protein
MKKRAQLATALIGVFAALPCLAQGQPQQDQPQSQNPDSQSQSQPQTQAEIKSATITIPAGTRIALVLTQPIESRYVHRGDDIFAQVLSPVDAGNQVVIPAGTFVQGAIDKLERRSTQGELRLESLSITFPDGYVTPIAGPITLQSDEGYALKDPGGKRMVGAFALAGAGAGIGALIGHSIGKPQSEMTSSFPAGCVGPPPFCTTTSTPVFGTQGRDTAIGIGVGAAIGMGASLALLFGSHHFYLVAGAPIQVTLQQSVSLQQDEVEKAVQQSQQHPVPVQPVAPLPVYYPPPYPYMNDNIPPPNPGTPPMVIPGTPGPDGVPGPPTVIPGMPNTSQ